MFDINIIIWLFPIIFMFHDFEEIIIIKPWFVKNGEQIKARFPKISKRLLPYTDSLTTSSLSLGVAGMFMLVCIVTITANLTDWYYLWFGVFTVFTLHLLSHCLPGFVFKGYVPAIVTSVICLPLCCYLLVLFLQLFKMGFLQAALSVIMGIVVMMATRLIMHIVMQKFDRWLNAYQNKYK